MGIEPTAVINDKCNFKLSSLINGLLKKIYFKLQLVKVVLVISAFQQTNPTL